MSTRRSAVYRTLPSARRQSIKLLTASQKRSRALSIVSITISTICDFDDVLNDVLRLMNLYKDEFRPRENRPRPPRETFPRGLRTMDKRCDLRRRLRCVKIARQF